MSQRLPLVLSVVALVVAIASATPLGTAASRLVLPPGSVGTKQLRNGAVTAVKVHTHSLGARVFKRGTLLRGPQGPQGPQGQQGPAGPSNAFSSLLTGPAPVAVPGPAVIASLAIPETGAYVVYATAYFDSSGSGIPEVSCVLDARDPLADDSDQAQFLTGNPTPVAFSVVHDFAIAGTVDLSCGGRAQADAHSVRITAIRVGSLVATTAG